jgi:antitoxin HicB
VQGSRIFSRAQASTPERSHCPKLTRSERLSSTTLPLPYLIRVLTFCGDLLKRFLDGVRREGYAGGGREEKSLRYRILITVDEDGRFVAECPSLPGCVSQGETRELALENIQDAIKGYLESLKKHGDPIPPSITEEIVEVNV